MKGIKLNSAKVDIAKERDGDWVDYPDWPGVRFKVRSVEAPLFKEARDELIRRRQAMANVRTEDDKLTQELGALYARFLLCDWAGLLDDDGKPLPYSQALATDLLSDPAYRNLTNAVLSCAMRVGRAELVFMEGAAGN